MDIGVNLLPKFRTICSYFFRFHHFLYIGNWDTLEVQPKARFVDTREELLQFYDNNYSANLMHLVVYAKGNGNFGLYLVQAELEYQLTKLLIWMNSDSLDISQSLVQKKFQEIRNANRICASFIGQPCTPEHLQVLLQFNVIVFFKVFRHKQYSERAIEPC